jgi:uncharacterized protein YciI
MANVKGADSRPGQDRFQIRLSSFSLPQQEKTEDIMPEYVYLIHPYRHGFFEAPTPEESAILDEHFTYLKQAAEAGAVVLAGPCTDDTFGIVVFRAESDAAAQAFMYHDPSVEKNIMAAELHPMRISIQGQ